MPKAAVKASEQRFYDFGMQETKARLIKELAGACREYCQEVQVEALNLAGVHATLDWRRAENIYYPEELRGDPTAPLGLEVDAAPAATMPEQLPSTQVSLPPPPPPRGFQRAQLGW